MRKKYKYSYTICNQPDEEIFYKQCKALEKYLPGLIKEKLLEDIDGSLYQKYQHNKGEIIVCNHIPIGAVYVDSDFDLLLYFE